MAWRQADWVATYRLVPTRINLPTNNRGHTPDLFLTNFPNANPKLEASAAFDHYAILNSLHTFMSERKPPRNGLLTMKICSKRICTPPSPQPIQTPSARLASTALWKVPNGFSGKLGMQRNTNKTPSLANGSPGGTKNARLLG